jgi:hypothetical protein
MIHIDRRSSERVRKDQAGIYDEYQRCCLQIKVEGDDVMTRTTGSSDLDRYQSNYLTMTKSDYAGIGTFGQPEGSNHQVRRTVPHVRPD